MPKTKPIELEQRRRLVRGIINGRMERQGLKNPDVAVRLHCHENTFRIKKNKPGSLRLDELWTLCALLGLTDEEIVQMVRGKEIV